MMNLPLCHGVNRKQIDDCCVVDSCGNGIVKTGCISSVDLTRDDENKIILAVNKHDELVTALKRARELVRLVTVRQVIGGGDKAIEAAGLNPWCINEGADLDDTLDTWRIDAALEGL